MDHQGAQWKTMNYCPVDGKPRPYSPRYPRALCRGCADRATDLAGRPIRMGSTSIGGGFGAMHADDGSVCEQVTSDGMVLVDGIRHVAGEAHLGGVVVQPEVGTD